MIAKLATVTRGTRYVRRHRVHTRQTLEAGREILLEEGPAHHLGRVLRVSVGQEVTLFNGDGHDFNAKVARVGRRDIALRITARRPGLPEPGFRITVAQCISRGERMDATLQKCTELGVAEFQPLLGERSKVRLQGAKLERRLDHWQGVVIAACEQCGRARVPPVLTPLSVAAWLEKAASAPRLVLDPDAAMPLASAGLEDRVELVIGPEGGFSPAELASMRDHGAQAVHLGRRVLRTETAAPAAVAILQFLRGDLGQAQNGD